MDDEDIKKLFKRLADLYELEVETARTVLLKVINILYEDDLSTDGG